MKRARMLFRVAFILCVWCCAGAAAVFASPAQPTASQTASFEELRVRYFRLRNTDQDVQRSDEWQEIADALAAFASKQPADSQAPLALYFAAVASQKLARTNDAFQSRAKEYFELITTRYARDDLADDALLQLAEISLDEDPSGKIARGIWERVVEEYAESDSRPVAQAKLAPAAIERPIHAVERKSTVQPKALRSAPLVVIDPGHGGEDKGAEGVGGLLEKDVVLAIARDLAEILENRYGMTVVLTRERDEFVPLSERTHLANETEADIFVSLHTNASPNAALSGLELYYLDPQGDEASRLLAERENASGQHLPDVDDLGFILSDLIQQGKLDESMLLADLVGDGIMQALSRRWKPVTYLGVKKAPFYVLVGAHMPCILAELFFIDHATDGKRLGIKDFRRDIAQGMASGIARFFAAEAASLGKKKKVHEQ